MTAYKSQILLAVCFAMIAPLTFAKVPDDSEGLVDLFDGKTLRGWEGDSRWFHVEDGAIVAGSLKEPIPHNFFLATTQQYGDFELTLEAKLVGEGNNAGIQFRTRRIENHHEVSGYQADMGGAWNRPVWGSLYDESRRRKMLADPKPDDVNRVVKEGEWNRFRIRCQGPRVQIWLNDLMTVDYTEADESIDRSGVIALQIHGGKPAVASYRKIRIRTLD